MREIIKSSRFKKELKRAMKRGCNPAKLAEIILLLANDTPLPTRCRPHKLSGNYDGLWECHIEPDWLLIYTVSDEENLLELARTGTHSDLFKK